MANTKYDALALSKGAEFRNSFMALFRDFTEEEKEAHIKKFGKTTFGLCIVRNNENLDHRVNQHIADFRFFWRAYPCSPEFQPDMFTWNKISDDLYGGTLTDESFRTRTSLPAGGTKVVPR